MFELLWSDHLLAEVERVLVDYKGLTVERAAYFCECIRQAFPEGRVPADEYLPLVRLGWGRTPTITCTTRPRLRERPDARLLLLGGLLLHLQVPSPRPWCC